MLDKDSAREKIVRLFRRKPAFPWKKLWIFLIILVVVSSGFFLGLLSYAGSYQNRVNPGIYLGEYLIGGMKRYELVDLIQSKNDQLTSQGLKFSFDAPSGERQQLILSPLIVGEDGSIDLVYVDAHKEADRLLAYGKRDDLLSNIYNVIASRLNSQRLLIENIQVNQQKIMEILRERFQPHQREHRNANIEITSVVPLDYEITSSSPGVVYVLDTVPAQIKHGWSKLKPVDIYIENKKTEPTIVESDVELIEPRLADIFALGGLRLSYTDPHLNREYNWFLKLSHLRDWLQVQKNDQQEIGFGLDKNAVLSYFEINVAPIVDVQAENARFEMNQYGRVVEFKGSRPGISLDEEGGYDLINDAILQRSWHDEGLVEQVQLAIEQVEPEIKTGQVNDLGVAEVLGVGISDFSGSPRNRIRNIANAVAKLNGVLVKPDEIFSTLVYTRPFTIEGGYYPELVIKGDEIKPEIGGGLCQIGTTLFRMAMNSGMEIVERRNHSLVVHYYDDPVNGLPGTDATIYDPAPDFKFKNDTDNYVLLQAEADYNRMELIFTLWGTDDGRKAYYTHPKVTAWIPPGETRIVETTKLDPGEKQCQHAYTGANAYFTYVRQLPGEDEKKIVYSSHYRPLPEICLVGIGIDEAENTDDNSVAEESD